jgi:hypothetical protein
MAILGSEITPSFYVSNIMDKFEDSSSTVSLEILNDELLLSALIYIDIIKYKNDPTRAYYQDISFNGYEEDVDEIIGQLQYLSDRWNAAGRVRFLIRIVKEVMQYYGNNPQKILGKL